MTITQKVSEQAKGVSKRIYSADVTSDNNITDRCLRKWIVNGRFPPPDGNLNGRNFWLPETYRAWQADVLAGRYSQQRRPGAPSADDTAPGVRLPLGRR
jgi:hypothetical protein